MLYLIIINMAITSPIYISYDKGRNWKSISNDLPEKLLLWRVIQDHQNKELLFLGTEFGVYFTNNSGKN